MPGTCTASEAPSLLLVDKYIQSRGDWWAKSPEGQGHWESEGGQRVVTGGGYCTTLTASTAIPMLNPNSDRRPPGFPEPL